MFIFSLHEPIVKSIKMVMRIKEIITYEILTIYVWCTLIHLEYNAVVIITEILPLFLRIYLIYVSEII